MHHANRYLGENQGHSDLAPTVHLFGKLLPSSQRYSSEVFQNDSRFGDAEEALEPRCSSTS
jgi:hypothetical protein